MQESAAGKFYFEPPFTSLDHLVGAGEQRRWDFQAERLRGSGVYRARRLLGPLPDRLNDHTLSDRRHRIGVPEFVPRERERSFLISPVKIGKRAALHVSDQGMI